jgi:hypothetical protein
MGLHQYGVLHRSGAAYLGRCTMKKASAVAGFLTEWAEKLVAYSASTVL